MFSVFLSSYRNTHESLRELEKAVETQLIFSFNIIYLIAAIFDNFDMNKIITLFYFQCTQRMGLDSISNKPWYIW